MAVSVAWAAKVITVPQADLTLVSGSLYECDTDWLRLELKALEASAAGMCFPDTHDHNTEYTVAGVTYARKLEIINGYSVQFTPDAQWSVRLVGSNNNLFDVENGILVQNQVQVIANNSAGLQSAQRMADDTQIARKLLANRMRLEGGNPGTLTVYDDDGVTVYRVFDVTDKSGSTVVLPTSAPAERTPQ